LWKLQHSTSILGFATYRRHPLAFARFVGTLLVSNRDSEGDTNMLSDARIRAAKPRETAYKLSDSGGLHALIQPHGSKLWRLAYRYGGKQKTLALGVYPLVGLRDAREQRNEAKQLLAKGVDPSAQRRLAKQVAATGNTFRAIAEEVFIKQQNEGRADATLEKLRWLFEFAYPSLAERPIADITAPELLAVLRKVEVRGRYETARRLRSTCGMVFRYAIATGRAERDPSADLRGALTAPKVTHRAAIVDPSGIGALLRAIEGYDGHAPTRAALRLAPLVFVRPVELRHAEWSEFDLSGAQWSIPTHKMKMLRPHRVPLAKQSIAIIQELRKITGDGRWLFPSVRSVARPISENTLNAALRRLGYGPQQMTTHGFRAMASTRLNEMGLWNADAIERQLAHQEADDVRRAYIHAAEYWPERVRMMQTWADYLDALRDGEGERGRRVISFR
jgi:integrase